MLRAELPVQRKRTLYTTSATQDRDAVGDQRLGHAAGRGRTERTEFGTFLELFRSVPPIDDGVAKPREEGFGALREQYHQGRPGDARFALERSHELPAKTAVSMAGRYHERAQQYSAAVLLEPDRGDDATVVLRNPETQSRRRIKVGHRKLGSRQQLTHCRLVCWPRRPYTKRRRGHHAQQAPAALAVVADFALPGTQRAGRRPGQAGGVGNPILIRSCIAAGSVGLLDETVICGEKLSLHAREFRCGLHLKTQMVHPDRVAALRNGKGE